MPTSREEVWEKLRTEHLPRLKATVRRNLKDLFTGAKTWEDVDQRLRNRPKPETLDDTINEVATVYATLHAMRHGLASAAIGKACRWLLLALILILANAWYVQHTSHPVDRVLLIEEWLGKLAWACEIVSVVWLLGAGIHYWITSRLIRTVWNDFRGLLLLKVAEMTADGARDDIPGNGTGNRVAGGGTTGTEWDHPTP